MKKAIFQQNRSVGMRLKNISLKNVNKQSFGGAEEWSNREKNFFLQQNFNYSRGLR